MSDHELTTLLVGGLATALSGLACLLLTWLRDDLRNLAEKILSLQKEHEDFRATTEREFGVLKGKGILE